MQRNIKLEKMLVNNRQQTLSRLDSTCLMILTALSRSSSKITMTNRGVKQILSETQTNNRQLLPQPAKDNTHIFTCVSLASMPQLLSSKHSCHTVLQCVLCSLSITMVLSRPCQPTSFMSRCLNPQMEVWNCSPSTV